MASTAVPDGVVGPGQGLGSNLAASVPRGQRDAEFHGAPGPKERQVRDAWFLAHPAFPRTRPGLLLAMLMGLSQAAQSWHMNEASTHRDHEKNKNIVKAEATNGALVAALFITVTTSSLFSPDGIPQNGMESAYGMTNLYFTLMTTATFFFAMSIIYSLTLLLVFESAHGKDATDLSHALGLGIHWPITNFIIGVMLLLVALFVKGFFDVDLWVWIVGIVFISLLIVVYFFFLATAVQAQWDVMDATLRAQDTVAGGFHSNMLSGSLQLAQEWIRLLPDMDDVTRDGVLSRFQDQLIDAEALIDLTPDDFAQLGLSKLGWQKTMLRRAREELRHK